MAKQLIEQLVAAAQAEPALELSSPFATAILDADAATRAAAAASLASELRGGLVEGLLKRFGRTKVRPPVLKAVLARLLEAELPFSEEQLAQVLAAPAPELPIDRVLYAVERHAQLFGLPAGLRKALEALHRAQGSDARIAGTLARLEHTPAELVSPDGWGTPLIAWLQALEPAAAARWSALFAHCLTAGDRPRPSARWSRQAAGEVAAIGASNFATWLQGSLAAAKLGLGDDAVREHNQTLLKGLLWAAAGVGDEHLAHHLSLFAERCFKKIPGVGPASTMLGNACVFALGAMPGGVGVPRLSGLSTRVRFVSARRQLDRALEGAAERAGQSRGDLEELAVPHLGLDGKGVKKVPIGDLTAQLAIVDGGVSLQWLKPNGKVQASVPKAVKDEHPEALEALKAEVRELETLVSGQTARLQRLWLEDRRLPLSALRERYLEHPVVGQLARRLLWLVESAGARHELIWQDGRLALAGGARVDLPDDAEARLWHMLDARSLEDLLVWRDHLDSAQLTQPFAQLWREVYRPLDGSADADHRFAGNLVHQRALLNVAQQRGWRTDIQGRWNGGNDPMLPLPRWKVMAVLQTSPADHKSDQIVFNYLAIEGLQFFPLEDGAQDLRPLRLSDVPPLVFSEVMRDVDLFIGAATVANEASFREADLAKAWRDTWRTWMWGELAPTAQTRGQLLTRVLPRTTLRDRARVEERWLIVKGPAETFRIHLGTANARRENDDHPLPVVADRQARERAARVFLPFEGDSMLSTILGKAFLLAGEG